MIKRLERDLRNLSHLRQFALPIIDALADWPDRAIVGRVAGAVSARWPRARCDRPARVLQMLADLRPMADVGPVDARGSARRPARSAGHARLGAAGAPLRPAVRRHAASGARPRASASSSCPGSPSASCRSGRARIRCCSTSAGATLDRRLMQPGRARQRRAAAAEDRDRRGDRAAVSVVSAPRRRPKTRARVPSFYALDVMRAITGRVPDHRVLAPEAAEEAGASLGWPAPHDPDRADRRSRARPRGPQAAARLARPGGGQGPGALPARPERGAASIGHQPLGARQEPRGRRATA